MFYEVKRTRQALTKQRCIEILTEEKRGVLSVQGEDGYPYAMPMNHYYDSATHRLYFHGGKVGYKIDCLKKNPKCSYVAFRPCGMDDNGWAKIFESVIVFGRVSFLADEKEIVSYARKLCDKFTEDESYVEHELQTSLKGTAMFYIEIEHMTGKTVHEK